MLYCFALSLKSFIIVFLVLFFSVILVTNYNREQSELILKSLIDTNILNWYNLLFLSFKLILWGIWLYIVVIIYYALSFI